MNVRIGCKSGRTFRIKSYSEERFVEVVENNLRCLADILHFNIKYNLLFFRITSDLIPFASHPICRFPWQDYFKAHFQEIGKIIQAHKVRISMHPDQFTVMNARDHQIVANSRRELLYHAHVLDLMETDSSAKIQIHLGGVYEDKVMSKERFIRRYHELDERVKMRLVIENDERSYTLRDCLDVHDQTGIPVVFDYFHHQVNNSGESGKEAFRLFTRTWRKEDGVPMVDYSSQQPGERKGRHVAFLDEGDFTTFIKETQPFDFDLMLEIKDKEKSALRALEIISQDDRFSL